MGPMLILLTFNYATATHKSIDTNTNSRVVCVLCVIVELLLPFFQTTRVLMEFAST